MRKTLLAASCVLAQSVAYSPVSLTLDASTALHRYDGHGALSAGASSRLLWDYEEPYRSQILDYLFKPKFGGALHTLKVEIGGDGQSTDGTEPSHKHTRDDLSCNRGYELWLIQQAKARNPAIQTYGLTWADPAWVGNGTYYSADNIEYQVQWMKCIQSESGYALDFMGLWNEKPQPDADYVIQLRQAMDAAGFANSKIIVMDGQLDTDEITMAQTNATYAAAIHGAGLHYPCDKPAPEVRDLGWTFWSSEDYSRDPAWDNGGTYWGKALSQNYVLMNQTATISWSLIWSAYTNLVCNGAGLMRAHQPWSGNYEVSAPIWLSAHWTQFVEPGWLFLHVPGGGSGFLRHPTTGNTAGTYVTLVPPGQPNPSDVTIIIETLDNNDCIRRNYTNFNITVSLANFNLQAGQQLYVWRTTDTSYFYRDSNIVTLGAGNTFTVSIDADSMVTVSTIADATHGSFPASPIPAAASFPLPYSDDFSTYLYDTMAAYFSDQGGSWAVRNGSITQVGAADPGPNAWAGNPDPLTQIGDETWSDYAIAADVVFSDAPPAGAPAVVAPSTKRTERRSSNSRSARVSRERVRQWRMGKGLPVEGEDMDGEMAQATEQLGNEAVLMAACDATVPSQYWYFSATSPGYLSNDGYNGDDIMCLNINGCNPASIIVYECVNDPDSSSCGAPAGQYPNLVWNLTSQGALTSPLDGWALTLNTTDMQTLYMAPFTSAPNQVWKYGAAGPALLSLPAYNQCLATPVPRVYAQVCGRITSFNGFDATTQMPGYCLQLDMKGVWTLVGNGLPLITGNVTSPFVPTTPHRIAVSMAGPVITAYIDGAQVGEVTDAQFAVGNAAIGSGWHQAAFDNFDLTMPL